MQKLTKWLKPVWLTAMLFSGIFAFAQSAESLTLDKAYELAEKNYPAIKQRDLIRKAADINIENLGKGFLPQLNLSGQASYQSDVTKLGVSLPGFTFDPPSKDQYKIVADVNLLLYDGGNIREQKAVQEQDAAVQQQQVSVELYQLKDRINQLYLGVLFLDEQQKQVTLVRQDLQTGIDKVNALLQNGVAYRSDLNVLKAELLKAEQRSIEIGASRKGLLDMLSIFLNQSLAADAKLEKPLSEKVTPALEIARPEIKLFEEQSKLLSHQDNLIHARNLPSARIFLQDGYGRPGLNFLKNGFDNWYIAGIRLNWSFSGFYTAKKEKALVKINQQLVDIRKETFVLNTNTQLKQEQSSIDRLEQLINSDDAIIELRRQVKESARAQLDNGVITANDYLREVNEEDQARQSLITHQIQLLQSRINYKTIAGKQ